jgi:hypothetical protein
LLQHGLIDVELVDEGKPTGGSCDCLFDKGAHS